MRSLPAPAKAITGTVIVPTRPAPCGVCGTDTSQPGHTRYGREVHCAYVPPRQPFAGVATEDVLVAPPSARRVR